MTDLSTLQSADWDLPTNTFPGVCKELIMLVVRVEYIIYNIYN